MDQKQIERTIVREEVAYYAVGLLHLKMIEVKAKQGDTALTSNEKDLRKITAEDTYNVPQPISNYLSEIGTYRDKMGKDTLLELPPLPVAVAGNFGGYHANMINADTHNLFEEVPSLGISGDMVMALASPEAEPTPDFHVRLPPNSTTTTNLAGKYSPIGPRRPEIGQRLAGYGITATHFAETIPNTRFNLKYFRSISDILGTFETFRIDKTVMKNTGSMGGETQAIKTRPSEVTDATRWTDRHVQSISAATSSTADMGAAFCFGFQLYKEDGPGQTRAAKTTNWSCITGTGQAPWTMPDDWYENRNARRNLPDGIGTERFRAISMRQDIMIQNSTRRLIKTQR